MDINRNPYEIAKFAENVMTYQEEMRAACRKMQGDMDNATGTMQDDTGLAALSRLSEQIEAIEAIFPGTDSLQRKLKKVAALGDSYLNVKY